MTCYYCGGTSDGSLEHVPPEVLYRSPSGTAEAGFTLELKRAESMDFGDLAELPPRAILRFNRSVDGRVIRVESCRVHNESLSDSDHRFAALLTQSECCNWAGVELQTGWALPQIHRAQWESPAVRRDVFGRFGLRSIPIAEGDDPYTAFAGHGDLDAAGRFFSSAIFKIVAGIHYARAGLPLGDTIAKTGTIESNDFRAWAPIRESESLQDCAARHVPSFHWQNVPERTVVSGHPQVFYARQLWSQRNPRHLAVELVFFGGIRFRVVVPGRW